MRATRYKVVETQTVTDEDLEEIINEWVGKGWVLDGVQFAMREASKRPAMAFVIFTRTDHVEEDDASAREKPDLAVAQVEGDVVAEEDPEP